MYRVGSPYRTFSYRQWKQLTVADYSGDIAATKDMFIIFKDQNLYTHYTYNTESDFKLVLDLQFNFINGKSCDELTITLSKLPEELSKLPFNYRLNDVIEVYRWSSMIPLWSGYIYQMPNVLSKENKYVYKARGFMHKLSKLPITGSFTNTQVTSILKNVANQIVTLENRIISIPESYLEVPIILESKDYDNEEASSVMDEFVKVGSNAVWGVDASRQLFYTTRDLDLDRVNVYSVDMPELDIDISQTSLDAIENYYSVTRKADSGSGNVQTTETYDSGNDNIAALDGLVKHITSIERYGTVFKKFDVPSATSDQDAMIYGTFQCLIKAFPRITGKVQNIQIDSLDAPIYAEKTAIIFAKEKLYIDEFEDCQDSTRWTAGSGLTLTTDNNVIHDGTKSIKVTSTGANGSVFSSNLVDTWDLSQANYISFWLYTTSTATNFLSFGYGNTSSTEYTKKFTLSERGRWERIQFNIDCVCEMNYVGFNVLKNDDFLIYVDGFEVQHLTRKKYELEIKRSEYMFKNDKHVCNIELGDIENPFADNIVSAFRNIKALQATSKNND